jgi:iron(III) transport system substrate-binding protein
LGAILGAALSGVFAAPTLAQDKSVVVYTAHKASIVDTLLPMFEKETGIRAEVVKLGSSDIARRVRAESGKPAADVIWSVTGSQLTEYADLLEPYRPKEMDKVDPQFIESPAWTPYTAVVYVLAVNTEMQPMDGAPRTWAALADPKWKGQIALTVFGDKGWDEYGQIAKNFVFTDSSGAVPRFVADGETSLGLMLEDNALEYVRGGAPMEIVHLEDGTATTPDGIALVKGGPNTDNGRVFIDWAMSKATQERLVQDIGRRSVRTDVSGPQGTPALTELKLVKVKPLQDFGGADAVLAKWRQAIGE